MILCNCYFKTIHVEAGKVLEATSVLESNLNCKSLEL